MADRLLEWTNDANAYELLNTYKVEQQILYPFVNNSKDFYISLLNRLFFTLREESIDNHHTKEKLLQLAKGLIVYSNERTANNFRGINRNNNLLYIAAIYFICEFYALSNLFIRKASKYKYGNNSAQLLYNILTGSNNYPDENNPALIMLHTFFISGNEKYLELIDSLLNEKIENNQFYSLDDFYDTHIAVAVLKRLCRNKYSKL